MPHENCNTCNHDYDITGDNAKMFMYLDFPRANHVEAKCTSCGVTEVIYVTSSGFMAIMSDSRLPIAFAMDAPDELKARANQTWGENTDEVVYTSEAEPDLPDAPNWMLREIYDDCRNWRGVIDGITP